MSIILGFLTLSTSCSNFSACVRGQGLDLFQRERSNDCALWIKCLQRSIDTSLLCVRLPALDGFFPAGRKEAAGRGLLFLNTHFSPGIKEPALRPLSEKPPEALCKIPGSDPTSQKAVYLLCIPGNELESRLEGTELLSLNS